MRFSEGLAIAKGFESGLNVTSLDQSGILYPLHYRESWAATCAEQNFWAICHSQPVQVDRLPAGFISTCFYSSKMK